jgi:hypothetical protein
LKNVQVDLVKRKRRHSKTDGEAEPRATQTEREREIDGLIHRSRKQIDECR